MRLFNSLFILILSISIGYGQNWETLQITESVQIDFPILPEISTTSEDLVFNTSDSSAIYLVNVRDLSNRNIDLKPSEFPEFYSGIVNGAIDAANGELLSKKDIALGDFPGVEITLFSNSNPQLPELRSTQFFFINQKLISISFWTTEELKHIAESNKKIFFDSFKLIEENENPIESETMDKTETDVSSVQDKEYSKAYSIGYWIGQSLVPILIILLIVGLVLLIRKSRKK